MLRTVVFLVLVGVASLGAAWIADQHGDVSLVWNGWRVTTSIPVFALGFGVAVVAVMVAWSILRGLWRLPGHVRRRHHQRKLARGRHAITHGLIAVGTGHAAAARQHAVAAKRHAGDDPLALLLHAQAAQLSGDRDGAREAFLAMTERPDTRLLGLRGLFIEAQRHDDPVAAVAIAEEALKVTPDAAWASHAVLGFRCASGDWTGALAILDRDHAAGAMHRDLYERHRAVLLTARALETETGDREAARTDAMEAVRLAPTLVPAAVLAARFLSEQQQIRKAMHIVESAWRANPHPDLADAYAHVRLGDSAQQRLARIESLAARTPGDVEAALAVARAAIDAHEFAKARAALAPLLADPTQRVAMLMAEIARGEHADEGTAREWTLRAVRARHDPAWTADGYVSDRWRPVSPVSGRLDAFQWVTPVAALTSAATDGAEPDAIDGTARRSEPILPRAERSAAAMPSRLPAASSQHAKQDLRPDGPAAFEQAPVPPVFRPRFRADTKPAHAAAASAAAPAAVIPLMRAPDDPGVDDGDETTEATFDREPRPLAGQEGGWRGFLARWVG